MRIAFVPIAIRTVFFIFWLTVIGFFLHIPTIVSYFSTQRSLTIFTWPLILDPIYLKNFEKETGIKLYITYFENGQTLLSKLAATKGHGYDLVIPDDHSLELLIAQGLVKHIDKKQLDFWDNLNPELLGNYADPKNEYSIPYYWGLYGIGYDKDVLSQTPPSSWGSLFNPSICPCGRICMTDDPREATMLTAQYLFGTIDALKDPHARQKVKELLIAQKKNVEVYTIARSDNLLQSKSCALAAIMSPEVWRLQREHPNIDMVIPKEGSFIILDSVALSRATQKDAMIYQLLNYLYRNEAIAHHVGTGYCSPLKNANANQEQEKFCPIDQFKSFDFFRNVISDDDINELWVEVLAS